MRTDDESVTSDNTAYTLRAYALALFFDWFRIGRTLLPSVATSYMLETLDAMPILMNAEVRFENRERI